MATRPLPQALLMVDLQKGFFTDHALLSQRAALVAACNTVARKARDAGAPVFEIRTVHTPDRASWSLNMLTDGTASPIESTPSADRVDGLSLVGATVVEKTRDSAFHGTSLAEKLGDRGISSLAICGVSTESCIAMTAAEAYARDLHVILVSDALASVDAHAHHDALDRLRRQYRQDVLSSDLIEFERRLDDVIA